MVNPMLNLPQGSVPLQGPFPQQMPQQGMPPRMIMQPGMPPGAAPYPPMEIPPQFQGQRTLRNITNAGAAQPPPQMVRPPNNSSRVCFNDCLKFVSRKDKVTI